MTGIGDDNINGILKSMSGHPELCAKYNTEVTEQPNVDELLVIQWQRRQGSRPARHE